MDDVVLFDKIQERPREDLINKNLIDDKLFAICMHTPMEKAH